MKKLNSLLFLLVGLFVGSNLSAQDILVVSPGEGTLNDAIDQYGGDRIYELQAGAWYGLTKPIENVDYHLQVIGEEVDIYGGETLPATLQTGSTATGTAIRTMFDAKGDITVKNLYLMNVDLNGQLGFQVLQQSKLRSRSVFDNCVIDPVSNAHGFNLAAGESKLFVTNNIILRHGHMVSMNDGHMFLLGGDIGQDTVWIENNTFVDLGIFFIFGGLNAVVHNVININHNTFIRHKGEWDFTIWENEMYHTNNLLFDVSVVPIAPTMSLGRDPVYTLRQMILADSIVGEDLPSERTQYLHYNSLHRTPEWYPIMGDWNDSMKIHGLNPVFYQPLMWDAETPAGYTEGNFQDPPHTNEWAMGKTKEAQIFNYTGHTNDNFPKFTYGSMTYDQDPLFVDSKIYDKSIEYGEWAFIIYLRDQLAYPNPDDLPTIAELPSWHWDPDGDITFNDTWPIFNGKYTDASTLTGSIENLPLGDLNWFPEEKAKWENHKDAIFTHMKAGNTGKFELVSVDPAEKMSLDFSRVYPNPIRSSASIEFILEANADVKISVYNTVGQEILMLVDEFRPAGNHNVSFDSRNLPQGMYFCTVKVGSLSEIHKLIITK